MTQTSSSVNSRTCPSTLVKMLKEIGQRKSNPRWRGTRLCGEVGFPRDWWPSCSPLSEWRSLEGQQFTLMSDSRNLVEYTVDQSHPCKIALENQTVLSPRYWGRR